MRQCHPTPSCVVQIDPIGLFLSWETHLIPFCFVFFLFLIQFFKMARPLCFSNKNQRRISEAVHKSSPMASDCIGVNLQMMNNRTLLPDQQQRLIGLARKISNQLQLTWIAERCGEWTRTGIGTRRQRRNLRDLNLVFNTTVDAAAGRRIAHLGVHASRLAGSAVAVVGRRIRSSSATASSRCRQLPFPHHLQFACSIPFVHGSKLVPSAAHPIRSHSCK